MACKSKTINNITDKFTIRTLPVIKGESDYSGIKKIMQPLYAKAATFPFTKMMKKPRAHRHHNDGNAPCHSRDHGVGQPTRPRSEPHDTTKRHHSPPGTTQHDKVQRMYENTGTMDKEFDN